MDVKEADYGICGIGNCWFDDVKFIVIGEAFSGALLQEIAFLRKNVFEWKLLIINGIRGEREWFNSFLRSIINPSGQLLNT